MHLQKIQNNNPKLPQLVSQALIDAIESGQIQVGQELPSERDLAETLGVSRGALRECLAILEFLGAIEKQGYRKIVLRGADYIRKVMSFIQVSVQADKQDEFNEFRKVNGVSYRALHWRVAEAEAAGEWDIARKSVNIYRGVKPDQWAVNCVRVANVNATDPESMSAAEVEGRRQVQELMHFFHKYVPGCENATLMASGSTLGIRESRHIEGDYVLTVDDILSGTVFEDSILLTSSSVDVHGKGGNMSTEYRTVENGRWYGVPYRCLLPKNVEGLLVAGRCLSATSDAAGAVRVMPPVMAMGQAAGTAAAIAVKEGQTPREIDVTTLVSTLKDRKVFLG